MAKYVQGGWYDNPATGQNQRWMNGAFLPNASSPTNSLSNSDPMSDIQKMISDYQSAQDAYNKKASDYYKNNPFNADDMLAQSRKTATDTLSPYYNELMGNFMAGINHTRQTSLEDEHRAVSLLQADSDAYTGQAKANLQNTLLNAGQQYSDAGSYDSGARARTQGNASVNEAYDVGNEQRQTQYNIGTQQLAGSRLRNSTLPLQVSQQNLQTGNEESQAINNLASQTYQNDVANYNYNAQKTIGAPPGESSTQFSNQIATMLPYVYQNIPSTFQSASASYAG